MAGLDIVVHLSSIPHLITVLTAKLDRRNRLTILYVSEPYSISHFIHPSFSPPKARYLPTYASPPIHPHPVSTAPRRRIVLRHQALILPLASHRRLNVSQSNKVALRGGSFVLLGCGCCCRRLSLSLCLSLR